MSKFFLILIFLCIISANDFKYPYTVVDLTLKTANRLLEPQENLLISGLGLELSLSMLYLGAKGNTAKQIEQALGGYWESSYPLLITQRQLLEEIQKSHSNVGLKTKLYIRFDFDAAQNYKQKLNDYYKSSIEYLDFDEDAAKSANKINNWVKNVTGNEVVTNFDGNSFNQDTALLLVNIVNFHQTLSYDRWFVSNENFNLEDKSTMLTSFLNVRNGNINYVNLPILKAKAVELSFVNNYKMIILLPNHSEVKSVYYLLDVLYPEILLEIPKRMTTTRVNLKIPKMKRQETKYSKEIIYVLHNLGIGDLFDSLSCDLSGISTAKNGLHVSQVHFQTVLEIGEINGETKIQINSSNNNYTVGDAVPFQADHPFIYWILKPEMDIVFMFGIYNRPN